ncbi:MAG: putative hydroxymethylpyrimidine transporter CytX [Clostridia bacterium]
MEEKKTSVFSNALIWFGAAVSIAEILTGTLIAPLGFGKGLLAILLGHLIGCVPLYFAGLLGAKTGKSSMETVKLSFGEKGSFLFSVLNILQLVGWTAVMIISASRAATSVANIGGDYIYAIIIGILIITWVLIGLKNLEKVNIIAMGALFILTIVLSVIVFKGGNVGEVAGEITFGGAVELSVAMTLSWLPLIADYTRNAKNGKKSALVSSITYFFSSSWMFVIGMGAAIFTGESDIAKIMATAGLGIAGLVIIIFSTVTTTFLDVYSAGVSAVSLNKRVNEKWAAVIVCILGTIIAIFTPIEQFVDFLYLIGSVFAPMIAILVADVFILKRESKTSFDILNIILFVIGFAIYRFFLSIDTPIGNTLPVMVIVILLTVITNKIFRRKENA